MKIEKTWANKRAAFFASNPKCKTCRRAIDHYTRTGLCRLCQKEMYKKRAQAKAPEYHRNYVKKHRERIRAYQAKYYLANKATISACKKEKYYEYKQSTASYI
jgi:hypothetical protein